MVNDVHRVADEVALSLRASGVEWAFGHPGGEVVVLIDALRKAGIRFVLTRHETSAAFAAAACFELTGKPGVCVATLGPGATNLVTGAASALLERASIVAFTGSLAESSPAGATHQNLPLNQMFKSVTKDSFYLTAKAAGDLTNSAVRLALAERPGPVHMALAADVAETKVEASGAPSAAPGKPGQGDASAEFGESIRKAKQLIASARRPAIVAGLTAARTNAEGSLRQFARRLGGPVTLTPKSKGLIPEQDPLFLGVLDMAGDSLIGETLGQADLIVAIGCDVVELDRRWTWNAPVVHVDTLPNIDGYYESAVEVVGDIGLSLDRLGESLKASDWTTDEIQSARAQVLAYVRPQSNSLQPWQVVEATQANLGPDVVATCDVGAHKLIVGQLWNTSSSRRFFMANGLSSMGYSIPTAMAISLIRPQQDVVAFLGDGGLGMFLGELETLVRVNANVTLVVFADRSLELIARAEKRRGVSTENVSFNNPDFAALGSAFGIPAREVATLQDLEKAVVEARDSDGVRLIAAHIDGDDYKL